MGGVLNLPQDNMPTCENPKFLNRTDSSKQKRSRVQRRLKLDRLFHVTELTTGSVMSKSSDSSGARGSGQQLTRQESPMVDEMFDGMDVADSFAPGPLGGGGSLGEERQQENGAGPKYKPARTNLLNELSSNDRTVHANFQNNFGTDLYDDKDLE